MRNQMHTTVQNNRNNPHSYRRTARVVGVLYLAGMVIGIGGNIFIQSILTAPDAVFIAVMTLLIVVQIPVGLEYLKAGASDTSYHESMSAVLTSANLYAYEFGMTTVGVAGLILCSVFFRTNLIPRPLAVWGLVGYAILLCGSVLQILGFNLNSIQAIPGALWEGFIGIWLIVKGFNTSHISGGPSTMTSNTASLTPPLVGSAAS